ncbi:MAG: hypothetical protein ACPGVK_01865 [Halocynthiibacter sp.]
MKHFALALTLPLAIATGATADTKQEGRDLAALSFESIDTAQRGYVDLGEILGQRDAVFVSMDADDSGKITEDEFTSWGYGFQTLAQDEDKELAYLTALRVVFGFWDRNHDGNLTEAEHRKAVTTDFQRADVNGDAILNAEEFFNGFSVMSAIRTALKPRS